MAEIESTARHVYLSRTLSVSFTSLFIAKGTVCREAALTGGVDDVGREFKHR
jgi:hypothetical protein